MKRYEIRIDRLTLDASMRRTALRAALAAELERRIALCATSGSIPTTMSMRDVADRILTSAGDAREAVQPSRSYSASMAANTTPAAREKRRSGL